MTKTKVKLSQFKPQAANANKHTERGTALLEKSVTRNGWIDGQTAAANGEMISGTSRLELAADKFADVEPVVVHSDGSRPVIIVRDDIPTADDKKAHELSVAANAVASANWNPDGDLLNALSKENEYIAQLVKNDDRAARAVLEAERNAGGGSDAEPQIDRAAELNKVWKCKTGDLWRIGAHRLLCGDSTKREDVERVMGEKKAEFSFTDPPYNVGIKYKNKTDDNQSREEFITWCKSWSQFLPSSFCMTVGVKRLLWWRDILGDPQWTIAWLKKNGQSNTGFGGTNKWDPILVYGCKVDHDIDIIEVNNDYSEKLVSGGEHPTPKPIELWMKIIDRFTDSSAILYEPFAGTGTSLLASENLHRKCFANEIEPPYCAVILQRMSDAFPGIEIERIA